MKRKLLISGVALPLLLLLFVAGGYLRSRFLSYDGKFEPELSPAAEPALGSTVTVRLPLSLPLYLRPRTVAVTPPEHMVLRGEPEIRFVSYDWSGAGWLLEAKLTPLRSGELHGGELRFSLYSDRGEELDFTEPIPVIRVPEPVAGEGEPELLGALEPAAFGLKIRYWAVGALLLLLLLAGAIWLSVRRRRVAAGPPPPWRVALAELSELRIQVKEHKINLEFAFVRLTDVVRNYLTKRYSLPASSRTTDEFLRELNSPAAPLPEAERPFLREFLAVADLVKFARQPPDEAVLLRAVAGAEKLVRQTEETPEGGPAGV